MSATWREHSDPELSVATKKIAARVSGADTACARADNVFGNSGALFGSGSIGVDLQTQL